MGFSGEDRKWNDSCLWRVIAMSKKIREDIVMKTLMIAGALMCAPMALMAQTTTPDMPEQDTTAEPMQEPMTAPTSMPAMTAEERAMYNTMTASQRAMWDRATPEQRAAYRAATPAQRAAMDAQMGAMMDNAPPPMASGMAPQRVFAPMAANPAPAAMTGPLPVCTANQQNNCQNAGEGGAPGRSRALSYWPGKPRSEGK